MPPQSEQVLENRPFTALTETAKDSHFLEELLAHFRTLTGALATVGISYPEQHIVENQIDGRYHRFIFNHWQALLTLPGFVCVGFCGQRRKDVSDKQIAEINALDEAMVMELRQQPGVVTYCTALRPDGDYCNLILFQNFDALSALGNSRPHAQAARSFSPSYYLSTRIHDGTLDGNIFSDSVPKFRRTRYWDFTCQPIWTGERYYA